jgi:hypothetical protein
MRINPLRIKLGYEALKTEREKNEEEEKKRRLSKDEEEEKERRLSNDEEYQKLEKRRKFKIHFDSAHYDILGHCESFNRDKTSAIIKSMNKIRERYGLDPI